MREKRLTALTIALSMCAFLLGLSAARDALPGDMFQFVRSAPAHTTPVADLKPCKGLGGSPDSAALTHHPDALAPEAADPKHWLVPWPPAAASAVVHSGRHCDTPGCRGPPSA